MNYQSYSGNIHSLQRVATNTIITQLGQVAEGINTRFTCGGECVVPSNKPIKLVYRQTSLSSEKWRSVEFPGVSEVAMVKLLEVCSVASFGYKGNDINDQNAFKLEPDNFTTTFQISSTPILHKIQSIVPMVMGLKAELYKLNIYACGGFFKPHIDASQSCLEKVFGSLVVCLPSQFTGGELIVRHNKQEIKYDWSSSATDKPSALHWAAFFSDIEHEVLPVSQGYRVTLMYHLFYHSEEGDSTFDVRTNSFYKLLQAVLSNPVFMCDGGVLGFNSHYSYVFDTQWADLLAHINTIEDKAGTVKRLNCSITCEKFIHLSKDKQVKVLTDSGIGGIHCKLILDALPSDFPLLKGADYIVVESAKSLGLPVCVTPFLSDVRPFLSENAFDSTYKYLLKDFSLRFKEKEEISADDESCIHQLVHLEMFGDAVCRYKAEDITWCQELSYHQPAGAAAAVTNDGRAFLKVWYKSAAILIRIPMWSNYREKLIPGTHCNKAKSSGTDETGMVKDFKDVIHNYEDIVQEETQSLLDQIEELLNNECINKVHGLMEVLKEMQRWFNSDIRDQLYSICRIKCDLHPLKGIVGSESSAAVKVEQLQQYLPKVQWRYSAGAEVLSDDSDTSDDMF